MKKVLLILSAFWSFEALSAGGGVTFPNYEFHPDINNQESLQRGAKLFMNYCSGCHSLQYQRYNRLFKDAGIDPTVGKERLIFTGAKDVEQIHTALKGSDGLKWIGQTPPDLSLTERARGRGYVYNYLLGFYVDASRPLGFNNSVFPGASMPNPFWGLQGLQEPTYHEEKVCDADGKCETHKTLNGFKLVQKGTMNDTEFKQVAYDVANFLTYVSDPSALDRKRLGPWVLLFIAFLTAMFYLLKREYWRDIK